MCYQSFLKAIMIYNIFFQTVIVTNGHKGIGYETSKAGLPNVLYYICTSQPNYHEEYKLYEYSLYLKV